MLFVKTEIRIRGTQSLVNGMRSERELLHQSCLGYSRRSITTIIRTMLIALQRLLTTLSGRGKTFILRYPPAISVLHPLNTTSTYLNEAI